MAARAGVAALSLSRALSGSLAGSRSPPLLLLYRRRRRMAEQDEAEKNIEIWKVKKVIYIYLNT